MGVSLAALNLRKECSKLLDDISRKERLHAQSVVSVDRFSYPSPELRVRDCEIEDVGELETKMRRWDFFPERSQESFDFRTDYFALVFKASIDETTLISD